ncbi:MAG: dephospho-CoA kinase [Acidobacteria bacterium]|nr:MAG: dephospho-CoA kinase [Acidobacteriota bacterium]
MKIGLTGGIATGKSHVLSILRQLGCHVIDADQVAREVVRPCRPAYHELVREFGAHILTADGTIDRPQLAELVFADAEKRHRLNAIVHPRVVQAIRRRLRHFETIDPQGIVVVDGALILEVGLEHLFDKLIVAYCPPDLQVDRLMKRDRLTRQQALNRIRAQMPIDEKRAHADYVIDTSGSFDQTRQQVERVFERIQKEFRPQPRSRSHHRGSGQRREREP